MAAFLHSVCCGMTSAHVSFADALVGPRLGDDATRSAGRELSRSHGEYAKSHGQDELGGVVSLERGLSHLAIGEVGSCALEREVLAQDPNVLVTASGDVHDHNLGSAHLRGSLDTLGDGVSGLQRGDDSFQMRKLS